MIKEEKITSISRIERKEPVKQADKQVEHKLIERDARGRLLPGSTANPNGRPPAGKTLIDRFREHKDCPSVINSIFEVAATISSPNPHKDAAMCCKLVVDRLVPSLKASEIRIDSTDDQGFVFLPSPVEPEKE